MERKFDNDRAKALLGKLFAASLIGYGLYCLYAETVTAYLGL